MHTIAVTVAEGLFLDYYPIVKCLFEKHNGMELLRFNPWEYVPERVNPSWSRLWLFDYYKDVDRIEQAHINNFVYDMVNRGEATCRVKDPKYNWIVHTYEKGKNRERPEDVRNLHFPGRKPFYFKVMDEELTELGYGRDED